MTAKAKSRPFRYELRLRADRVGGVLDAFAALDAPIARWRARAGRLAWAFFGAAALLFALAQAAGEGASAGSGGAGYSEAPWAGTVGLWAFTFGVWLLTVAWNAYRDPESSRVQVVLGTIGGSVFLLLWGGWILSFWPAYLEGRPPVQAVALAIASAGALFAGLVSSSRYFFLKGAGINGPELEYLRAIVGPLVEDLPPEAVVEIGINPFHDRWSRLKIQDARSRSGYSYPTYFDPLLSLDLEPEPGARFRLRILHLRVDKIKNRKSKYKGTKHRVSVTARLDGGRALTDRKLLKYAGQERELDYARLPKPPEVLRLVQDLFKERLRIGTSATTR